MRSIRASRALVAVAVAVAALTGCATAGPVPLPVGQTSSPAPDPVPAPPARCGGEPVRSPASAEVSSTVTDGRVDPAPHRVEVERGTTVVLRVAADVPAEVHVHGYDRSAQATPSAPACLEMVADVPGLFEVEVHPDLLLLQLVVR